MEVTFFKVRRGPCLGAASISDGIFLVKAEVGSVSWQWKVAASYAAARCLPQHNNIVLAGNTCKRWQQQQQHQQATHVVELATIISTTTLNIKTATTSHKNDIVPPSNP